MTFNNCIFAFDFDGTLVPKTQYINDETNIKNFNSFKLFLNPNAFNLKWTIVTSRPRVDKDKIENVLKRCNCETTYSIYTQDRDIPIVNCDEEFNLKMISLCDIYNKNKKFVYYIDDDNNVINKMKLARMRIDHKYSQVIQLMSMKSFVNNLFSNLSIYNIV